MAGRGAAVSHGYVRVEPLSAIAFLLGGIAGIAALAWRQLHNPTKKGS